jgi:periplasmic protein TonB
MKTQSEHVQRWEDIIFEKRNKEYGAYTIRKNYNDNVLKAEAISIGIGLLIFIIPILLRNEKVLPVIEKPETPIVLDNLGDIKPKITPPVKPQQMHRANASVIPITPTTDPVPDEPVTEQPSSEVTYTTGPETGTSEPGNVTDEPGVGTEPAIESAPTIFTYVEKMPEYEGGYEAMFKFLRKNVKYPRKAQQRGSEGTVYVKFVISADGSITNVEIEKGFDKDCDAEAMRVISLMDKWHAGIQNGTAVSVRKILPITFKLN